MFDKQSEKKKRRQKVIMHTFNNENQNNIHLATNLIMINTTINFEKRINTELFLQK